MNYIFVSFVNIVVGQFEREKKATKLFIVFVDKAVEEKNSGDMAVSQSVHVVWDDPMGR